MTQGRTVADKVADWLLAYNAIRTEITPEAFRPLASLANADDVNSINIGLAAARVIFANDRAAATVAALITSTGIKPQAFDYGEDS